MAVFEDQKSSNDIINNDTMSDDEVVASDVPPAILVSFYQLNGFDPSICRYIEDRVRQSDSTHSVPTPSIMPRPAPSDAPKTDPSILSVTAPWSRIEKNTEIIAMNHFPMSEGVSEVSERANE